MRNPLLLAGLTLAALLGCATAKHAAKPKPMASDPTWSRIDSLDRLGQYATALAATEKLLGRAQASGDWRTEFRAWMYKGRFQQYTGTDLKESLREMQVRAGTANVPLAPLLRSVIADQWWTYYQRNRWSILDRTPLATGSDDPDTWDQAAFMREVIGGFNASLGPQKELAAIPVKELAALLEPGKTDPQLRPTLFDLLAYRALSVFRNSESRLAEPVDRFRMDDPGLFALPAAFARSAPATTDTASWQWQALQLYRSLTALHLNDGQTMALAQATLERLDFARANSSLPNKDSLYLDALHAFGRTLQAPDAKAEVDLAMAQWHTEKGGQYQRLAPDSAWKWEKRTAATICRQVIADGPGPFAVKRAKAMLDRLQMAQLALTAEEAVTPDKPFRLAVNYTNVGKLWLRVVPDEAGNGERTYRDQQALQRLLGLKPLRTWAVELPDDGDMNAHVVELPVEGLPLGWYSVIASTAETPGPDAMVQAVQLQVTGLAMAVRGSGANSAEVVVMDRQGGSPVQGAQVAMAVAEYRGGRANYRTVGTATTGADGVAEVTAAKERGGNRRWTITHGKDRLVSGSSYFWWRSDESSTDTLRTFLFTDRAIYRPGQPVMFKGIVTAKRGGTTVVKPGHKTTVKLFDVNYQPVDSMQLTTDAYGSFHGQFTAPQGVLTGTMTLREDHGSQSFRVEEYKRPTFEVLFPPNDTATAASAAKLGRQAAVHGLAKSYAGVPLDGAEVQWTVTRSARMPWWGGGWWRSIIPWGTPTEVASGTAHTDHEGRFTIHFTPEADRAIPLAADPVFNFNVQASITDLNGETQEGSTGLGVGYRSIDINLGIDGAIDRSAADSLRLGVQDLNGRDLDVPLDVRITRLQSPPQPLRDRLWERPDRHVLTQAAFKQLFPDDAFADEADPLTWDRGEAVMEKTRWKPNGKQFALEGIRKWDVGMYLIEVAARDADGKEVKAKKAVAIYDPAVQHTGFTGEAFHAEPVKPKAEPGESAVLLLGSALPEGHVLMEVERQGKIAVRRWFTLKHGQQRVELPVLESDRGGFAVHLLSVERGRAHKQTAYIEVPWSNKDLKVEWMTFRDKLLPGAKEEWRLKITGPKGAPVAAQLLAGMYDASLDHFLPHGWSMSVWPANQATLAWEQPWPFGARNGEALWWSKGQSADTSRMPPALNTFGFMGQGYLYNEGIQIRGARAMTMAAPREDAMQLNKVQMESSAARKEEMDETGQQPATPEKVDQTPQPTTRTDFRETAFFLPDLLTDKDGSVVLRFTMPEALTRWKLLGLAHTTDLKTATFTKEVITQKPLMVTPNLPRFLREGDTITLTAKVAAVATNQGSRAVTSAGSHEATPAGSRKAKPAGTRKATSAGSREADPAAAHGTATLELFDPFTNASLNQRFGLQDNGAPFTVAPGASAAVAWKLQIPEGISAVSVRITAKAGTFSDGEEKPLPILTDRVLVTESLPLPISKAGTKVFTLEKLKNNTSTTLRNEALKLKFTPNPAWYAVQALPYLMEYPHQCSEQVFSRLYANSLAGHIVDERPRIKQVFAEWSSPLPRRGAGGEETFLSNLEKNPELKSAILAETPWVLNAASEGERKQRIALLFDMQRMAGEREKALKQLRDAQLGNGAWPWFSGMQPSRWVTQGIVAGFGHLEKLGAADLRPDGQAQVMLKKAVAWLDAETDTDYKRLLKNTTAKEREQWTPGHDVVQYLYARSFFPRWAITGGTGTAVDFYKARLAATWPSFGLQEQAMVALTLHRMGDRTTAQLIMKSLGERATRSEELGMYWKDFKSGWYWWDFPTETHALLIEAFHEVAKDQQAVNELRLYLLKLKQTTDWRTTKATASACYALLLTGDDWLEDAGTPRITVGGEPVQPDMQEAGTGYFQQTWKGKEVKPEMATVSVTTTADRAAWGALYWQYFEQMDKVTAAESPFSIRKQVMRKQATPQGSRLVQLESAGTLKPGDLLTVRIELRTDRAMDYVHLKDLRASGLEPTETLSGYRFKGGLGWYQSTRDAATDFFFDRMQPGTYVLEYDLRVAHAGDFSNGITTALCMYAPEFAAHSEGVRIKVGE